MQTCLTFKRKLTIFVFGQREQLNWLLMEKWSPGCNPSLVRRSQQIYDKSIHVDKTVYVEESTLDVSIERLFSTSSLYSSAQRPVYMLQWLILTFQLAGNNILTVCLDGSARITVVLPTGYDHGIPVSRVWQPWENHGIFMVPASHTRTSILAREVDI